MTNADKIRAKDDKNWQILSEALLNVGIAQCIKSATMEKTVTKWCWRG